MNSHPVAWVLVLFLAVANGRFAVDPRKREVRAAAEYVVNALLDSTQANQPAEHSWRVTSAEKRTVKSRGGVVAGKNFWLTLHLQIGGTSCDHCLNPQPADDATCSVVAVHVVASPADNSYLIDSRSSTLVPCVSGFV